MHRTKHFGNTLKNINRQNLSAWTKKTLATAKDLQPDSNENSTHLVDKMFQIWLMNSSCVHYSWDNFFRNSAHNILGYYIQNDFLKRPLLPHVACSQKVGFSDTSDSKSVSQALAVQELIRGYQVRGHHLAQLDPLGLADYSTARFSVTSAKDESHTHTSDEQLNIVAKIKSEIDQETVFMLPHTTLIGGKETKLSLKEIISRLEKVYCNKVGIEYMHINNVAESVWIRKKFETPGAMDYIDKDVKRLTLARLIRAVEFENFLATKHPSSKRYGLEGCEAFIPAIKTIIDRSSMLDVNTFNLAMAHRGRLNAFANVVRKDLTHIFGQFENIDASDEGSGDIRYHLGCLETRENRVTQKKITISLCGNPSHLETVNPVAAGKTRAQQFYRNDLAGKTVMSIIVHGDAAISGQGIAYETVQLNDLPNYSTRGSIHIVINNQLGFSTEPRYSRSSPYCTACALSMNCPVFHVNAHDMESVIHVSNVAAEWRATFHRDVIIDIIGFRRFGHNEVDDPSFTQPIMYDKIAKMGQINDLYGEKLLKEGIVTPEEIKDTKERYHKILEDAFTAAKAVTKIKNSDWIESPWPEFAKDKDVYNCSPTGINEEVMTHIGKIVSSPPPESLKFTLPKGLERVFRTRTKELGQRMVSFTMAEAFAFGSLLKEGTHVRLSGEDCERGSFCNRHYVLHHSTERDVTHIPLNHLYPDQATFTPSNSPLQEYGVLSFELGYSQIEPNSLVIWEAQFGDFANVGQAVIDQFICSGQERWIRQSGLVMFLPHGMEGAGPDHSSCRPERLLQLCSDDADERPPDSADFAVRQLYTCNWIIVNCTTAANLFHVLRRQCYLNFRKPLIVCSPKSLLRVRETYSSFDELKENTEFRRVISDNVASKDAKRVVFTVGKVYYMLKTARDAKKLQNDIALVRIEQVSPFPYDLIKKESDKYPNAKLCFVQEEHKNQGCWSYCRPRFLTCLEGKRPVNLLASRPPASVSGTGFMKTHLEQNTKLVEEFLAG